MAELQKYDLCLHKYGMKNTRPRRWVLEVLLQQQGLVTAEEIYQKLLAGGVSVNVSTVYRVLELFEEKKLVEKDFLPEVRRYGYFLRVPGHIHHLICIRCHKKVDISACPLSAFEKQVAAETGFELVGHRLELYGLCRDCQEKEKREGKEYHE